MKTNWDELFKIRTTNPNPNRDHHEVVKLLIVRRLLEKYKRTNKIRIYTEYFLEGVIPDVYFENLKDKSVICYEIQKDFSKAWIAKKMKQYEKIDVPFFKSVDFIPINLNEFPTDIAGMNKALEKYIF